MGFFSAIAPVAASLVGGVLTNKASAKAADSANAFTEEQLKNRHQWEVADLKAAGLNPVLSANGTPSIGSSAKADVINPLENAVSSALQYKQLEAQIDKLHSDIDLNRALEGSAHADASAKAASARVSNNVADTSSAIAAAGRTAGRVASYAVSNTIPKSASILRAAGSSAKAAARLGGAVVRHPVRTYRYLKK